MLIDSRAIGANCILGMGGASENRRDGRTADLSYNFPLRELGRCKWLVHNSYVARKFTTL